MVKVKFEYYYLKFEWIFFKIFGYASYQAYFQKPNTIYSTFSYSSVGALYNITLIIFVSLLTIYVIPFIYTKLNMPGSQLIKIILTAETVLGVLAVNSTLFTFIFHQRKAIRIENYSIEIDCELVHFDRTYNMSPQITFFVVINIISILNWIFQLLVQYFVLDLFTLH